MFELLLSANTCHFAAYATHQNKHSTS